MRRARLNGAALAGPTGVAAFALCLGACGSPRPSEYARLDAAAARAYSAGRYAEAAGDWKQAASVAKLPSNRTEARYRQASSLVRAGRDAEAIGVFDRLIADDSDGVRAPRASLDRAASLIALGKTDQGYEGLAETARRYPESGIAPAALHRYLAWLGDRGEPAVRTYLDRIAPELDATHLGQHVHYAYAESLEREGQIEPARQRYLLVAEKYPYPEGALWDDALFHAADLDAKLGDPRGAIAHLNQMLERRETAYMTGSYERPRYADAQYEIGKLYRDALGDPAKARAAFETLFAEYKTSRLRDDAAWSAALIAAKAGDQAGACRDLRALIAAVPDSRYVPCAPKVCSEIRVDSKRQCAEYVLRSMP